MYWTMRAVLDELEQQMSRLYWNKHQQEMESPFRNTGTEYENNTFVVRAYQWDEDEAVLPNFEYKNLRVYWYKHSGRGLEWYYDNKKNILPPSQFLEDMLEDCIKSLENDWRCEDDF